MADLEAIAAENADRFPTINVVINTLLGAIIANEDVALAKMCAVFINESRGSILN